MRIASVLVFVLGATISSAQQPANKINIVPVQSTPADSGKDMFGAYCASCHGSDGKGAGPAATALKVPPADLTAMARHNSGKFPALKVVSVLRDGTGAHGSKEMPVWGPILSSLSPNGTPVVQQRITNLTAYIEGMQTK